MISSKLWTYFLFIRGIVVHHMTGPEMGRTA
jgi:hypothetical protein